MGLIGAFRISPPKNLNFIDPFCNLFKSQGFLTVLVTVDPASLHTKITFSHGEEKHVNMCSGYLYSFKPNCMRQGTTRNKNRLKYFNKVS